MEKEKIISFVKSNNGKEINIESSADVGKTVRILIEKLNYEVKENLLILRDEKRERYIFISLKNIKDVAVNEDNTSLIIYLEDDFNSVFKIERT